MKMKKQVLLWLAPVMLAVGVLSGCDNGGGGSVDEGVSVPVPKPKTSTFLVSPARVSLAPGAKQQFKAYYDGKEVNPVSWTVSSAADSAFDEDDNGVSNGLLTVSRNEDAAVLNVSASMTVNGKKFDAQVFVTVLGNGAEPLEHGVSISPPIAEANTGDQLTFTAVLSATGEEASGLTWRVDGAADSTIADGVLVIGGGETAPILVVRAEADAGRYGTAAVYIKNNGGEKPKPGNPVPVTDGLLVEPQETSVAKGGMHTFTAKDYEKNDVSETVSWRVTGGSKSGTTLTGGLLNVASDETAKYLVVRAEADNGSNGTAVVTVTESGNGSGSGSGEPQPATVTMTVTPNGDNTTTTTALTLGFTPGIADLSADEITIDTGNTGAAKGALSGSDAAYTLGLSGIKAGGSIRVTVNKGGYNISGSPAVVTVYKRNPVNSPYAPEMLPVEGGKMTLNGTEVTLSDFWISNHEVTQKEWYDVMGTTIQSQNNISDYSGLNGVGDNYPMYHVSWYEAVEYCNKLSDNEGLNRAYEINGTTVTLNDRANGYRLPTEAEWEYAARGGQQSLGSEYSGASNVDAVAWYTINSESSTHPVGGKMANELGLYDMSGNVYEWCWDWYGSSSYPSSNNDPTGASSGPYRVLRGGCWNSSASYACSANRRDGVPSDRSYNLGFRVARSAAGSTH
jgi:formylglycine-generating enzyme required for sulfatase activity